MNIAMILAGGKGTRMNMATPKQFLEIGGKPLIVYTLEKFERCKEIDAILVVCLSDYIDYFDEISNRYSITKLRWIANNGETRFESIKSGVQHLVKENVPLDSSVVIHNANMPFITIDNITECLEKMHTGEYDIVATIAKSQEYLFVLSDDPQTINIGPDREKTFMCKSPEAIRLDRCVELYNDSRFCDEKFASYATAMLGLLKNLRVGSVLCDSSNIKLTTESDLSVISAMMEIKTDDRTV